MPFNLKVLVVSEQAERLQKILTILDRNRIDTRSAGSCGEALKIYETWPADLVIGDHKLTGMQEMQQVEVIRVMNENARFILILSREREEDFRYVTPSWIVAFVSDGFSETELMRHVHSALADAENFHNRRRFSRFRMALDTHCILINPFTNQESRSLAGLIRDVSRSGASMLVRQVLPVPSMMKLIVELPQSHQSIPMLAKSMSCTMTQMQNVYRLGVKFVGLLPPEMEEAIAEWKGANPGNGKDESDIFMGKSFRKALSEWLEAHQGDLGEKLIDGEMPLPRLVDEVCTPPHDPDES
jgi:CheY-like chemotaxis protein